MVRITIKGEMLTLSIIILAFVFLLIILRQMGSYRVPLWQVMLIGAIAVLATLQITPLDALKAINLDVMLALFGMFIVGTALEESGYLSELSAKLFKRADSIDQLVLMCLFIFGISSAFLMNDTLAIIGTPLILLLARNNDISPKLLMLTLAFAITIGSVFSPIGNPQNLLIAISGEMQNPLGSFFKWLFIPTIINLFLAYLIIRAFYRDHFDKRLLKFPVEPIKDPNLKMLCQASLLIIVSLIALKILLFILDIGIDIKLTYIALSAALPILALSGKRSEIVKKMDWRTLVFFAAMFVLMESVWQSGFFQEILSSLQWNILSLPAIFMISIILGQFLSNVPLVALYLPILLHAGAGTKELVALAAGSTIAGNLFILGAASNIIIIQNAESRDGETLTFFEFAKIGIPLTIVNAIVYGIFLAIF